jgi:hypothetical protein
MVFCKRCGDGQYANRVNCPDCRDVSVEKKLELMTRNFYDALNLLKKIRDMDYRGNRHSSQELAFRFCERFRE